MVQFCYSRLYLGTETISCCLCQRMARMDMDCDLKKLGQGFQVLPETHMSFWFYKM